MSEKDATPPRDKLAVALRYAPQRRDAPVVVAKGRGPVAEAIERRAVDAGVPFHADPELARVLETIPTGEEIPEALYVAVAEVLAFAYHLRGWRPGEDRGDP
ncbi:MAG TPA: hypothetical protein ENK62_04605 [Chromatiales bacterium]|nr:hypothetical protein [Chromatiales bacterium]